MFLFFILLFTSCHRFFILLSHFLLAEDYELSQPTCHLLRVPLTLEYVRILFWSISFFTSIVFLMNFCVRMLSDLMLLLKTIHVTKHLTCRNKLRQTLSCNLILKIKFGVQTISIFHQLLFDFKVSRFGT